MRVTLVSVIALLLPTLALAADLPAAATSSSSVASSPAPSSASASASASGNSTTAAPASTSAAVSVVQSVFVSGNATRTLNVTVTGSASSSTRAANLSTASWDSTVAQATAFAPGASASGIALGPDDSYIAAAGKVNVRLWAAGAGAAALCLAVLV
ncbi:hypothetical protein JCM8547_000804 [Rhodosporidiobolus lusitaniae]